MVYAQQILAIQLMLKTYNMLHPCQKCLHQSPHLHKQCVMQFCFIIGIVKQLSASLHMYIHTDHALLRTYVCVHGSSCGVVSVCSPINEEQRLCVLPFSLSLDYALNTPYNSQPAGGTLISIPMTRCTGS